MNLILKFIRFVTTLIASLRPSVTISACRVSQRYVVSEEFFADRWIFYYSDGETETVGKARVKYGY